MAVKLGWLFRTFYWFNKQNDKFRKIRQNGEEAKKSTHFGIRAICFILIGIPIGVAIIIGGLLLINGGGVFQTIFGVFTSILGVCTCIIMLPYSLVSSILQLRMNRRAIGFISLSLLVVVVTVAVLLVLYFGKIL